ncbi:MAG: O-antigen ligase family protein [Bryobacteraceae bacterium]
MNLNSGPWLVPDNPRTVSDFLVLARVYAPGAVLILALLRLLDYRLRLSILDSPLTLLALYGTVSLVAGTASPDPRYATYWSIAFLATVVTYRLVGTAPVPERVARLLLLGTWFATLVVAAGAAAYGKTSIFGSSQSGYDINLELNEMSRSSGVARWAAVGALVLLLRAFYVRWWPIRGVLLAGFGMGLFIVYRMQSRGAVFGCFAALLFIAALQPRLRTSALVLLPITLLLMVGSDTAQILPEKVIVYLERGQTESGLYTMGGRTEYYAQGWEAFLQAPLLGRGQWADRLLLIGHIHNSFLEAALSAGVIGFVPYVLSWIAGWLLFFRLWRQRDSLWRHDRIALLECGATMAFFTVRAIPETTTAGYAPDLLIMAAVYAYLSALAAAKPGGRLPVRSGIAWRRKAQPAVIHA